MHFCRSIVSSKGFVFPKVERRLLLGLIIGAAKDCVKRDADRGVDANEIAVTASVLDVSYGL